MNLTPTTECESCLHRERPILVVSSRRFCSEILANFIRAKTPARCATAEDLQIVALSDEGMQEPGQLIFFDSYGLTESELLQLLESCPPRMLENNIFALLNLQRANSALLDLLKLGVRGFFFDNDRAESILKGICALKRGELWVPRETMTEFICQHAQDRPQENLAVSPLTRREKTVLGLLASGASNEAIASRLHISTHTVKTHIYNILKKIRVKNRLQAALWATKNLD